MIEVDGEPINAAPAYDPGHGWLGAAETALLTMSEFRRLVMAEKALDTSRRILVCSVGSRPVSMPGAEVTGPAPRRAPAGSPPPG